ncbi:MAG: hypothetical protein EA362_08690 [Saprospirales bacterium]|nr:MAG: hypothetical protein EA362_08690 [Saprospirales bacterium]
MKSYLLLIIVLIFTFSFTSCRDKDIEEMGLRPVFISYDDFSHIESLPPREFENLGKIVALGDFLFINEKRKGVHLIDNRNPLDPQNIRFFSIPGNQELIIIDQILYADNGRHLILIDFSDIENITVVDHLRDVYVPDEISDFYPENYSGWFACVNERNGIFNGWEEALLTNPKCRTN